MHSSVTVPSVCRKNGEALSRPLRGLKYAGLPQPPSKHTVNSPLLLQAGFNSAWASWGGELVGSQPGKWLKLTAMSHQKPSPSTSSCLCLSLLSALAFTLLVHVCKNATFYPVTGWDRETHNPRPCGGYNHQYSIFTGQFPSFPLADSSSPRPPFSPFIAWSFQWESLLAVWSFHRLCFWFTDWF